MKNESDRVDRLPCAEIAPLLDKQAADDPLQELEQQKIDHHLNHCEACRNFVTFTSNLPYFADTLSEKALLSAVDAAKDRYFTRRQKIRQMIALASLGAVAAAALFVLPVLREPTTEPHSPPVAATCVPTEPSVLTTGVYMTHCAGNPPSTRVDGSGDTLVSLDTGVVGVSVAPDRPDKRGVTVRTPFGEVRVLGTVFAVHVGKNDARVEVFRGTVEVLADAGDDDGFAVTEGHGATLSDKRDFELPHPKSDPFYRELSRANVSSTAVNAIETQIPAGDKTNADDRKPSEAGTDPLSGDTDAVQKGGRLASLDSLLKGAHACLIARDWQCAASKYQQILNHYAGRPESTSALISLAKIELRHLGKPNRALRHFSAYQKQRPTGPLAEEALFGIAEAHRQLGHRADERAALQKFIAHHPQSSLVSKAKNRLRDIEE